jgi:hypothetical protein
MMRALEKIVLLQMLEGCGVNIFTSAKLSGNPVSGKAMARKQAESLHKNNKKRKG